LGQGVGFYLFAARDELAEPIEGVVGRCGLDRGAGRGGSQRRRDDLRGCLASELELEAGADVG